MCVGVSVRALAEKVKLQKQPVMLRFGHFSACALLRNLPQIAPKYAPACVYCEIKHDENNQMKVKLQTKTQRLRDT